jgi:hypothetical protein
MSAGAMAGQPPAPAPADPPPDESFIEFLGADDVGDARWWEFLKNAEPRADQPAPAPPQDAKQ